MIKGQNKWSEQGEPRVDAAVSAMTLHSNQGRICFHSKDTKRFITLQYKYIQKYNIEFQQSFPLNMQMSQKKQASNSDSSIAHTSPFSHPQSTSGIQASPSVFSSVRSSGSTDENQPLRFPEHSGCLTAHPQLPPLSEGATVCGLSGATEHLKWPRLPPPPKEEISGSSRCQVLDRWLR